MIEIRCEEAPVRGWKWWRIYVDGVRLMGHWDSEDEARAKAGITEGLLRVAVGLEHIDDIKADLLRGLK